MLPTLLLISLVTFVIIQLPPGDYLETMISDLEASGERADLAKVEFLRQEFGLDQPLWKQYWQWLSGLFRGDLGYSFEYDRPVADIIGERLLLTFVVSFGSIVFTWLVAFPIGVYSATHQYSWGDHGLTLLGFLGLATPNFLLALILMFISFTYFGTSVGGLFSPDMQNAPWSWARAWDLVQHLWIPIIVIGTSGTAAMIRRLRANLLDELRRPYVMTARAKGLAPRRILLKYPLRIALNPFIGDIGNLLPQVISGAIIVSIVLSLPTTGPILLRALRSQDMYLAGSFLMLLADSHGDRRLPVRPGAGGPGSAHPAGRRADAMRVGVIAPSRRHAPRRHRARPGLRAGALLLRVPVAAHLVATPATSLRHALVLVPRSALRDHPVRRVPGAVRAAQPPPGPRACAAAAGAALPRGAVRGPVRLRPAHDHQHGESPARVSGGRVADLPGPCSSRRGSRTCSGGCGGASGT